MFNTNLLKLRKDRGFSQEQLAVRMSVTRQTISKWEHGLSVPDAELLIKLSEILDTSVSDLLGKELEMEDKEKDIDAVASELEKLNELLVVYGEKVSKMKKQIIKATVIIILLIFMIATYETWVEMWHEFGRNLFYMFND